MPYKSLAIWNQALSFHFSHWKTLLPVLPFLCLPVVGDVFHSLIICQKVQGKGLRPMEAVREVWRNLLPLFSMKLYFEGAAVLWGFVPIYGIIKSIRYRLYWAMASNGLGALGSGITNCVPSEGERKLTGESPVMPACR